MMRQILFFIFGFLLISCKSNYIPTCEPDKTCTTERQYNRGIEVKKDQFERLYLKTIDKDNQYLIHHKSEKINNDPRLQDAGYVEEVFIELPSTPIDKSWSDEALSELDIYFVRRCFCGPLAGTFPIKKGTISIKHSEKITEIDFRFTKPGTDETAHLTFAVK